KEMKARRGRPHFQGRKTEVWGTQKKNQTNLKIRKPNQTQTSILVEAPSLVAPWFFNIYSYQQYFTSYIFQDGGFHIFY
ncbi:hypothetical protein ACQP3C_30535, partial [Escherichia coli]